MYGKVTALCATLLLQSSGSYAWYEGGAGLPVVDLGYQIQQASGFNDTGNFYNFSNIRYAAPPVGQLRFAPPQPPAENRTVVNTGSEGRICPQGRPAWNDEALKVLTNEVLGIEDNNTTPYTPPAIDWSTSLPPQDPRTSEDCLFLDVFVPEDILASAGQGHGAPVLVWIYGGGYTAGDKNYNPAGLLAASNSSTDGDVIYVALNYRIGALGFSSGPSFLAEGGTSNAGLHDQRFALEWIQKYIHLFGGDPKRVTVFGESAGGGSVLHQITAYGGAKGPVPFQGAVPQSPGWVPASSQLQQEDIYQQFLNITNSTCLEDLRSLSSEDIIKANYLQIRSSPYGSFSYTPVVDGTFVPLQPAQLLAQGRFDKSVRVMVGHNDKEGDFFTPSYIRNDSDVVATVKSALPYIPQPSLEYVTNVLYPPIFDGSKPYTDQRERATLLVAEAVFTCNTYYLANGFDNQTYAYLFSVPPAFHGLDIPYTYYDGGAASPGPLGVNVTVALALQDWITSFAIKGKPQADGVKEFRMYGDDAHVMELDLDGIDGVMDRNANERCKWWQKALYT